MKDIHELLLDVEITDIFERPEKPIGFTDQDGNKILFPDYGDCSVDQENGFTWNKKENK